MTESNSDFTMTASSGAMYDMADHPAHPITLALHVTQDMIPLTPSKPVASTKHLSVTAVDRSVPYRDASQDVGYSPKPPVSATPMTQLARQHLHDESEFSMLCAPLSNQKWHDRWDRMCIAFSLGRSTSTAGGNDQLDISTQTAYDRDVDDNRSHRNEAEMWRLAGVFEREEINMTRSDETQYVIATASEWLELDSGVEGIRFDSELALKQELAFAAHLHVATIVLPQPRNKAFIMDYARCIADVLSSPGYIQLLIRIPITDPNESSPHSSAMSAWSMWDTIRSACSYNPRLGVMLDLSHKMAPFDTWERWRSEPVKALFLPASSYLANAKGYPVLSKSMQSFLQGMFKFCPTVVLSGIHRGLHPNGGPDNYATYIRHLERTAPRPNAVEQFAGSYTDYLQAPLQPLMDNLENDTYDGFERDPIKYRQYEEAIYQALCDRRGLLDVVDIFVCGAGRGPLVEGCIRASRRADQAISVVAVEKNPNAFVTLQERKVHEWGDLVSLEFSDMRGFKPDRQADIIVSELLGSFGDNELSPECLDGVMRCLKPDGVSIPCSYTSYLAPISSAKLHADIVNSADAKTPEQPYVVMFSCINILSEAGGRENFAKYAECLHFDHPKQDLVLDHEGLPLTNHHNARSAHVTFHIPVGGVCHGFAGYFEAILYGDVGISIHPERGDPNMLSWFPLFFPLKEPLYMPPRCEMDVHIFRLFDGTKRRVWFEWSAEVHLPLPAHVVAASPTKASVSAMSIPQHTGSMNGLSHTSSTPIISRAQSGRSSLASPFIGSDSVSSAGLAADTHEVNRAVETVRLKIAQTKLHNPGGRGHWVGL